MDDTGKKNRKFIYRQGLANLRIEGMTLSCAQHKLVMAYQSGKLTRQEFLDKAAAYARTQ